MKKTSILLALALLLGIGLFIGCDNSKTSGISRPPNDDGVFIHTQLSDYNYTFSLSSPPSYPPALSLGIIGFAVGVIKNGSAVSLNPTDVTWSMTGDNVGTLAQVPGGAAGTGARLIPTSVGTAVVKCTCFQGTIDEMSATVTIHIVA